MPSLSAHGQVSGSRGIASVKVTTWSRTAVPASAPIGVDTASDTSVIGGGMISFVAATCRVEAVDAIRRLAIVRTGDVVEASPKRPATAPRRARASAGGASGVVSQSAKRTVPPARFAKRSGVRRESPLWMNFLVATREEPKVAIHATLQGASGNALWFDLRLEVVTTDVPLLSTCPAAY